MIFWSISFEICVGGDRYSKFQQIEDSLGSTYPKWPMWPPVAKCGSKYQNLHEKR